MAETAAQDALKLRLAGEDLKAKDQQIAALSEHIVTQITETSNLEARIGRHETEIAQIHRIHEEVVTKHGIKLRRDLDRMQKTSAEYKKKNNETEKRLHSQTAILNKTIATLTELQSEEGKFKQEIEQHQKEKAELEGKVLEARQQISVLQREIDKPRAIFFRMGDLVKMSSSSPETTETDVGLSSNVGQEQLRREQG